MDPISIIGLVGSLVPMCVKITKSLNDIKTKYSQSNATLSAIISECSVIATALTHIENIAKQSPNLLETKLSSESSQLGSSFDLALNGCSITLLVLNDEIQKMVGREKPGFLSWKSKAKFLWNEQAMRDLLTTLRGQQGALHLLVTATQTESMADVRRILADNNTLMKQMVQRSQTLREKRAASTINGGQDVEFDFDDQIVTSTAYRRAFHSFSKQSGSKSKGKEGMNRPSMAQELPGSPSWSPAYEEETATRSVDNLAARMAESHLNSTRESQKEIARKPLATPPLTSENASMFSQTAAISNVSTSSSRITPTLAPSLNPTRNLGSNQTATMSNVSRSSPRNAPTVAQTSKPPRNPESDPLLRTASENGHTALIKMLVLKGADINSADESGRTPLLLAMRNGHVDASLAILSCGPDLSVRDTAGNTALNVACMHWGHIPLVKALLEAGMDIEIPGCIGWRPLHHAAGNDFAHVVDNLVHQGANIESSAENGDHPLHSAAEHGRAKSARRLLELGANIEAQNYAGNRPLNIAAMKNQIEVARLLLEKGADIEGVGACGWHPLHHAAGNPSLTTLRFLLDNGTNRESRADIGVRPLHIAVQYGTISTAKELLERGVDVSAHCEDNSTPLGWAAALGKVDMMELLINKGAQPLKKGKFQAPPIHDAIRGGHLPAVKFLLGIDGIDQESQRESRNEYTNTALIEAVQFGHVSIIRAMFEVGANIENAGAGGWRPLHRAAYEGDAAIVKLLIELGADKEARASNGDRPLHIAAALGKVDAFKILREIGADVAAVQGEGKTPLQYAVEKGHLEIVELLV